jgi:hypothetical protein
MTGPKRAEDVLWRSGGVKGVPGMRLSLSMSSVSMAWFRGNDGREKGFSLRCASHRASLLGAPVAWRIKLFTASSQTSSVRNSLARICDVPSHSTSPTATLNSQSYILPPHSKLRSWAQLCVG